MGSLLLLVVIHAILYKWRVQSLAPSYPIMEGDGKSMAYLSPTILKSPKSTNII